MTAENPSFLDLGAESRRRRIAYRHCPASAPGAPGLLWLIGLKSDMASTKAEALAAWARERGLGMTRFDYSGHGLSGGRFEEAVTGDWIEEATAVFTEITQGPQIVVGSSTGCHIALMMLRRLLRKSPDDAARILGLVLIAPAWDLTEALMWQKFPEEARQAILTQGYYDQPSDYDPRGYRITRAFIEEGRRHLIGTTPFDPGRPIAILQGREDRAVPVAHARALLELIEGGWGSMTEVADGEHRLSRPQDLDLLYGLISGILARRGGMT